MKFKYILYADDLLTYVTCKICDLQNQIALINIEINKLVRWCNYNYLKLNTDKTKAIIFGAGRKIDITALSRIYIEENPINSETNFKYLGVQLCNNFSWSSQVTSKCNKAMRPLYQLKMNNKIFSTAMRRQLVLMLILPFFDYCAMAFCNMPDTLNSKLQRAFNLCIRYIF